ncbi:hypothetical protein LV75_006613 [Actinokineospora diospyrosa]|uniref:Uncharacterized protein n=1 Tax=Actinokineospora diospyrosa TaxID=103728 RepID=A0ABT1IPJ5_9PSEU|nr:hypothetical protein [Actinokineospora diospyrosa]
MSHASGALSHVTGAILIDQHSRFCAQDARRWEDFRFPRTPRRRKLDGVD